jgi:hypothetical protein
MWWQPSVIPCRRPFSLASVVRWVVVSVALAVKWWWWWWPFVTSSRHRNGDDGVVVVVCIIYG